MYLIIRSLSLLALFALIQSCGKEEAHSVEVIHSPYPVTSVMVSPSPVASQCVCTKEKWHGNH